MLIQRMPSINAWISKWSATWTLRQFKDFEDRRLVDSAGYSVNAKYERRERRISANLYLVVAL